jgi:glycosyltransferase involved in cell wall biosynthesis
MQYLPYLRRAGLDVQIRSFFDSKYLQENYAGRRNKLSALGYLNRRLAHLRQAANVIWVEKEALPWIPWAIERALLPRWIPIVSDYDDALFHRYDQHPSLLVRQLLGRKIDGVMGQSQIVFAGNEYLAERARGAGAKRVEIVPTVLDTEAYDPRSDSNNNANPRIGWIGTPTTWSEYGEPMAQMLNEIAVASGAIIRIVGVRGPKSPYFEYFDWSEDREIALIQGMDVGIMPLLDTPWARGKCGYKLIQYMASKLPVVASPVGVNSQIVEHGVNGFLATTEADWRTALFKLLADPDLRRSMGSAGRRKVEERFSLQTLGPQVAKMLHDLCDAGGPS